MTSGSYVTRLWAVAKLVLSLTTLTAMLYLFYRYDVTNVIGVTYLTSMSGFLYLAVLMSINGAVTLDYLNDVLTSTRPIYAVTVTSIVTYLMIGVFSVIRYLLSEADLTDQQWRTSDETPIDLDRKFRMLNTFFIIVTSTLFALFVLEVVQLVALVTSMKVKPDTDLSNDKRHLSNEKISVVVIV